MTKYRDFSFATQTQNDKVPTCHTADSPCHTERSEVSTMESGFFANAQNDKRTGLRWHKKAQNEKKEKLTKRK